jgi:glycine/D-amino acid oxidase-like deaminating enzyme
MRTRYGVSHWLDRYPKTRQPAYARLRGTHVVDVAVVGGGLSGCATAYALAMAGARVVVLEANRIGQGATGLSPGLLRLEPAVPFHALQETLGLRAARTLWTTFRRAGLDFAATIRRLKIRSELVPDAALRAALNGQDPGLLTREIAALRKAGVEGTWLTPARLRQETGLAGGGAIRSTGDGYVDPYRVTLGMAAAAVKRGAEICERSTVTRIAVGRQGVEVLTDGGRVQAARVVVAANYPSAAFRPLRRHFDLVDAYCVLTPVLPSFVRREFGRSRGVVLDQHDPPHVFRRTSDDRLLAMGAEQPHVQPKGVQKAVVQRTGQLMYELSRLYPAISGIRPDYGWSVPVALSTDGMPVVGPHRNFPGHLFVLGLGHHGVGAVWLAARAIARHYLGHPTKEDDLLGFGRLLY